MQSYARITRSGVLSGELYGRKITEVNSSLCVYRLFHEDCLPMNKFMIYNNLKCVPRIGEKSS